MAKGTIKPGKAGKAATARPIGEALRTATSKGVDAALGRIKAARRGIKAGRK